MKTYPIYNLEIVKLSHISFCFEYQFQTESGRTKDVQVAYVPYINDEGTAAPDFN